MQVKTEVMSLLALQSRATIGKALRRILPFLMLLYFVAFLDRVNVGFAALTMNADLALSASVFGTGAGVFFLGYVLFSVPSNLALQKYGPTRWLALCMVVWGLLSCAMAFVRDPASFYTVRFLLGVAEAGFFPGVILYLTYWFPAAERGKITGIFLVAIPLSNIIGAPVSALLLSVHGAGLVGWQWLFILEGAPAVILGFFVGRVLAATPMAAAWLTQEERVLLTKLVADGQDAPAQASSLREALTRMPVWILSLAYFAVTVSTYGLGFWLPQIVNSLGEVTKLEVGLLTAMPYVFAAAAMVLWGRHSDRSGERIWHVAGAAVVAAIGFAAAGYFLAEPVICLIAITVAAMGFFGMAPIFWTLPPAVLSGTAAAGGFAVINSIGSIGGYFGPAVVGYVKDVSQSYTGGLYALAGIALSGCLVLLLPKEHFASHRKSSPS